MHSLPLFGLGIFFALAGIGLFAITLRKAKVAAAAPMKKAALREAQVRQAETVKLRIAAVISVAIGAALMMIS